MKVLFSFTSTKSIDDTIVEAAERTYNYCDSLDRYNPSKVNFDRLVKNLLIDLSIMRDTERYKTKQSQNITLFYYREEKNKTINYER